VDGAVYRRYYFRELMNPGPIYHKVADLPSVFPIFPLSGALILPRGRLPLNIFEPRYLNMIDDCLSGERVIGMIQPHDGAMGAEPPALYPVGCVGRLTSFAETTDGRYLVTLTGICRFRVMEELSVATPYRQVVGDFRPYQDDIKPNPVPPIIDRDRLMSVLNDFMERKGLETDWDSVKEAPSDLLVNSLSMICPLEATEKQALLEAATIEDRLSILLTLLEMATRNNTDGDDKRLQ